MQSDFFVLGRYTHLRNRLWSVMIACRAFVAPTHKNTKKIHEDKVSLINSMMHWQGLKQDYPPLSVLLVMLSLQFF